MTSAGGIHCCQYVRGAQRQRGGARWRAALFVRRAVLELRMARRGGVAFPGRGAVWGPAWPGVARRGPPEPDGREQTRGLPRFRVSGLALPQLGWPRRLHAGCGLHDDQDDVRAEQLGGARRDEARRSGERYSISGQ